MPWTIMLETAGAPRKNRHRQRRWVFCRPAGPGGLPQLLAARPR